MNPQTEYEVEAAIAEFGFEEPDDCSFCGGDGYTDCDDPLGCLRPHIYDECLCSACGGSGLAKDQTIW